MANLVLGIFPERSNAEKVIDDLKDHEYDPKNFSIVMKDQAEAKEFAKETGAGDVVEGAATGATTGAILGGLAGLLASTVLPGLGAFFIGGPIAAALGLGGAAASTVSGAVTGAAAGGLLGALTSSFGLSEDEARYYETSINRGGILIAVPSRTGEEDDVKHLMMENGGDQIKIIDNITEDRHIKRTRDFDNSRDFAPMGVKGGRASERSSKDGKRGWFGDNEKHSISARGEDVPDRGRDQ